MGLLFQGRSVDGQRESHRLDEPSLIHFFEIVRKVIPKLATSQFYILFDDAGYPNIPHEAQHVLNDLVTSSNSIFCMKLSAERYSYEQRDSAGRTLEETHDLTSFDIASSYASEGGFGQTRDDVKNYFWRIMKKRLEHWHYPSVDIAAYLGDQKKSRTVTLSVSELIARLALSRKDAYYSGWEVVWQLADKTPRNLIELVSEIFAHAKIQPAVGIDAVSTTSVGVIKASTQDRAIRAVSLRRLRALEFTPGEVMISERRVPLGRHLYLCASTFGKVSHRYLTQSAAPENQSRLDERLAIERNDTATLRKDAEEVQRLLVRYGIFDDSSLATARDDRQKKPILVFNRIFCPAFGISFRRDSHLRLSVGKFEMFMLKPAAFLKKGTALLRGEVPVQGIGDLWKGLSQDD